MRGSREVSLVSSLHRASTDALIFLTNALIVKRGLHRPHFSHTINNSLWIAWLSREYTEQCHLALFR